MKKNLANLLLGGSLGLSLLVSSAFAENKPKEPNEYYKLSKDQLFDAQDTKGEKFKCGQIEDVWTPVEKTRKGYITYQTKIKQLRGKLNETKSSRKKKKIKEQIKQYKTNAVLRGTICLLGKGASDPVTFDFSNSVGMMHAAALDLSNLNLTDIVSLRKFDENGNNESLVKTGTITTFTYSLDPYQPKKAYIQLLKKINPQNPMQSCVADSTNCCTLLEVDMETGNINACIDNYVSLVKDFKITNLLGTVFNNFLSKTNIDVNTEEKVSAYPQNVQSDSQGNVFYVAYLKNGNEVLARRQPNGTINYFRMLKDTKIDSFIVIDNSEVLVAYTSTHKKGGLVRIDMANEQIVQDYNLEDTPTVLVRGGDGYIYVGLSTNYNTTSQDYDIKGIKRLDLVSKALEERMYIGYDNISGLSPIIDLSSSTMCTGVDRAKYLCDNYAYLMNKFTYAPATSGDSLNLYGVSEGDYGEVMRLNNGIRAYKLGIKYTTNLIALPNNQIVGSGYGLDGYKTVIMTPGVTPNLDTIETIFGGEKQYDINQMYYVSKNNTIHFLGTRISDNKSVAIVYDVATKQVISEKTPKGLGFILSAQTYFPELN